MPFNRAVYQHVQRSAPSFSSCPVTYLIVEAKLAEGFLKII
jgi:hypothetical protein